MAGVAKKGRAQLLELLNNLSIKSNIIEHPEVFTVETMMEHLKDIQGHVTKNLFLKDKKKNLYLVSCDHTREVKLNDLCKKIGAANSLRFADEAIMIEILNVAQGCCTPLALCNDTEHKVKFIADKAFFDNDVMIYSHPMENNASLGMTSSDFLKFLNETGHEPVKIDFES